MAEKTGVKFFPTFIIVAFLGVLLVAVVPMWKGITKKVEESGNIIVLVEFVPKVRSGEPLRPGGVIKDVVTISWRDGNEIHVKAPYVKSAWKRVTNLRKGQSVEVWAEQFQGDMLRCRILQDGVEVTRHAKYGASEVHCTHVIK